MSLFCIVSVLISSPYEFAFLSLSFPTVLSSFNVFSFFQSLQLKPTRLIAAACVSAFIVVDCSLRQSSPPSPTTFLSLRREPISFPFAFSFLEIFFVFRPPFCFHMPLFEIVFSGGLPPFCACVSPALFLFYSFLDPVLFIKKITLVPSLPLSFPLLSVSLNPEREFLSRSVSRCYLLGVFPPLVVSLCWYLNTYFPAPLPKFQVLSRFVFRFPNSPCYETSKTLFSPNAQSALSSIERYFLHTFPFPPLFAFHDLVSSEAASPLSGRQ